MAPLSRELVFSAAAVEAAVVVAEVAAAPVAVVFGWAVCVFMCLLRWSLRMNFFKQVRH